MPVAVALWEFLMQGSVADSQPPKTRFNLSGHYDGTGRPGTIPTPGGMFLEDTDLAKFDASFFNTSYADAIAMDPQHRLLLEASIRGAKIGCLVGANTCEYEAGFTRDPEDQVPGTSIGLSRSILSNRIRHFLDITGPSITLNTACSSTLIAIDMACSYLQSHQADGMFVAGLLLFMDPGAILDSGPMGGAFSTTGRCHTVDAKADGYVRGEAINVVFLKRLSDAIRDGDPIRAVIRGTATNSEGRTPGLTYPSSKAHAHAMQAAYQRAGIANLNETGYLECHGTGTLAGDPIEVAGIASPLIIGSIKSNVGHSEPAAGLSGLIKAVLAIERGIIPGNPTFITPNPRIYFQGSRVRIVGTRIRWPTSYATRRARINSFGSGGANAHAVLEQLDSCLPESVAGTYRKRFVSSWTANQHASGLLRKNDDAESREDGRPYLLALSAHLVNPAVSCKLRDVAYTLSEKRTGHLHRAHFVAPSLEHVANITPGLVSTGKQRAQPSRIGFVFTGQGAQWSLMGKSLVETFPAAEECVRQLDRVLRDEVDPPPSWSLLEPLTEDMDAQRLRLPELAQPLTTALQLAMLAVLRDWGIQPRRVVGHSSGEIAAAAAAGRLTPSEAIKLAYFRSLASQRECTRRTSVDAERLGMLAVGASAEDVAPYLDREPSVQIACYNSPGSATLSGPQTALQRVQDAVKSGGRCVRALQVDSAYHHSEYMAPVAVEYERLMREQCQLTATDAVVHVSVFSSVSGGEMTDTADLFEHGYWRTNMVSPVRFSDALSAMVSGKHGSELLIEIGPSNALAGPVTQTLETVKGADTKVQYVSAAKRGPEAVHALLGVAGVLWACGSPADLSKANGYPDSQDAEFDKPSLIIDLPNYHQVLKLDTLPWLREYDVRGQVIFPGAGYIALAIEAIYQFHYRLQNVKFLRGLVLGNAMSSGDTSIVLGLNRAYNSPSQWHEFRILERRRDADVWSTHCVGLIRIEQHTQSTSMSPSPRGAFGPLEYAVPGSHAYRDAMVDFQWLWGDRRTCAVLSMDPAASTYGQSSYPIHLLYFDSFLQLCGFPVRQVQGSRHDGLVIVPASIDSLFVSASRAPRGHCAVSTQAYHIGVGSERDARYNKMPGGIYDPAKCSTVLVAEGHMYATFVWDVDLSLSDATGLAATLQQQQLDSVQRILDLFLHRQPSLHILEVNTNPSDTSCLWLDGTSPSSPAKRLRCENPLTMRDRHTGLPRVIFQLADPAVERFGKKTAGTADLVLLKTTSTSGEMTELRWHRISLSRTDASSDTAGDEWQTVLEHLGFSNIKLLSRQSSRVPGIVWAEIASAVPAVQPSLHGLPGSNALVSPHQWDMLQELIQKECNILWVTSGSQLEVSRPHRATSHGLLRVIRNEEPHLRIVTLDVEEHENGDYAAAVGDVEACLNHLASPAEEYRNECEFVERAGLVYTSRVLKDDQHDEVKSEHVNGRPPRWSPWSCTMLWVRAERRGVIDFLHCKEKPNAGLPPPPNEFIEVDVCAAGVNFKDVAVAMGWAAGNQHKLGLEGANIVSRVGAGVPSSAFKPGQRVVFLQKGSFANRVHVPMQAVYAIPDAMSLDVAASLPVAYLTSLYALFDLGNLKRGQRVLIHSAAGAVGNAAMQICRYMGAEIYATVGNDEKRVFLQDAFGIPSHRIFSSRTAEFERKIMEATDGHGVDLVLNSLSGDLLEASWNTVAFGGTLVKIGKRDISDQNRLPMGPFNRGASFHALDLSLFTRWGEVVARLFSRLFKLLDEGKIKPIFPLQRLGFDQVQDALIRLCLGQHIGKLVLSSGSDQPCGKPHYVQVRPAPRTATYRDDVCYLVVSGLRGLCASLAVDLAKRGVKHIATMSRSGYDDLRSQIDIRHIRNLGSQIDLAFSETTVPVVGIIQGAMVPLDRPFSSMTSRRVPCRFGRSRAWPSPGFLHLPVQYRQRAGRPRAGQHVAANAFLDSFPAYRYRLGLPAHTSNLGVVEDVGFMVDRDDVFERYKDSVMTFINEDMLCKMVQFSILQQNPQPVSSTSLEHMVTGLEIPQASHSGLRADPRFARVFTGGSGAGKNDDESKDVRALKLLLSSSVRDPGAVLDLAVKAVSAWLFKMLRLRKPVEAEQLCVYGLDSLAAVEFRNRLRSELGAVLTTLDITTTRSISMSE
ncbi:hypothetical protein N657DRAFT_662264 [Parathielavia appendiculata]|uniref:Carrier domain-containing protein n=1 Tax=Parathielavia appendiculata TaxID=2587402 RepID=A0AAN6Z5D7_9PEZI|nr:hypothetical protein N657DRAFT_662264 [Parathielavia appendiculata]